MLSSIRDATLKRDFPFRRIGVNEVGFRTDDVNDDVFVVYVLLEFEKPLEVASSGSFCLRWRRKKKEKITRRRRQDRGRDGTEEKERKEHTMNALQGRTLQR